MPTPGCKTSKKRVGSLPYPERGYQLYFDPETRWPGYA